MNSKFNIKRLGKCLKIRYFNNLNKFMLLIGLGFAIFASIILATTGDLNGASGFVGGMIGGLAMFQGIWLATNKYLETLLPALPSEKFLSFAIIALLNLAVLFAVAAVTLTTTAKLIGCQSAPDWTMFMWALLGGVATLPITIIVVNITNNPNLMGFVVALPMVVMTIPMFFHTPIVPIIYTIAGIAFWITAYATYCRRQVESLK